MTDSGGSGGRTRSITEALGFIQMVKDEFEYRHPYKYRLFLRMMIDFKNQRIDRNGLLKIAGKLFQDTPELAMAFNQFMPDDLKLQVDKFGDLAACLVRDMSLDDEDH